MLQSFKRLNSKKDTTILNYSKIRKKGKMAILINTKDIKIRNNKSNQKNKQTKNNSAGGGGFP